MIALLPGRLFDGAALRDGLAVLVEDGLIRDLCPIAALPDGVIRHDLAADSLLAPGFVDLQVNGGGGVLFNDEPNPAGLARIAQAHRRLGTTAILPTLISSDAATRGHAIEAVREALAAGMAGIAGLHLEGPFLAPARRGIHPAEAIATPDAADMAALCAAFPAPMLITLAPEIVQASYVARLAQAGRIVFAGHSDATLDQAMAGFDAGITGTTHLFNAMSQLGSRAPGLVGAALLRGHAGIIVDLLHVAAETIRIAHRVMGPRRLFLVSDAMSTVGSTIDRFDLGGRSIRLSQGRLQDAAGTLAGAHLCMAQALRHAVQDVGIGLEDALAMATATPADAVGLSRHGRIAPGCRADFVVLDAGLAVRDVWQGGVRCAAR